LFVELRPDKSPNELRERYTRTELFLDYLRSMEERELASNPHFGESDFAAREFMPDIIEAYKKQQDYMEQRRAQMQDVNTSENA